MTRSIRIHAFADAHRFIEVGDIAQLWHTGAIAHPDVRGGTPPLSASDVNMTAERANRLIADGLADIVAFGRPYITNPDLVERLVTGAPLAEIDWETVYASGPRGYSDYPAISRVDV